MNAKTIRSMVLATALLPGLLLPCVAARAQVADEIENLEMLHVIHTPTAGVLKRGQYSLDVQTYGNGGAVMGVGMGLFDRFMFGVSYGGEQVIGYGDPLGNGLPGVVAKYRLVEESMALPAFSIGFDMQGHGTWYERDEAVRIIQPDPNAPFDPFDPATPDTVAAGARYLYKAPGAFVAVSRNWLSDYGRFGVHFGVNYNAIEGEDEGQLDGFFGTDFSLNEQMAVLLEYDLALDDREEDGRFGEGPAGIGYFNAGLRFTFARSMVLQFDAIDLLNTSAETRGIGRELKVTYVETFQF